MTLADPKPAKRIRDSVLVRNFSIRAGSCAVCGKGRDADLQAHHVLLRSRGGDDVTGNLVALCLAHHEAVHHGDRAVRHLLGEHVAIHREDVLEYLVTKLGREAAGWFLIEEYGAE